jgi:tRNA-dihydrouridine synthase 1
MFHAKLFAKEEKYRDEHWVGLKDGLGGGGPKDRPLVTQVQALS